MINKNLLKLRLNRSQSNFNSKINSRKQLNTSDSSISSKKKLIKKKLLNLKILHLKKSPSSLNFTKSQILLNQVKLNNQISAQKKINNNSQIISNNISSILNKIRIPKKVLTNRKNKNNNSFLNDESLLKTKRLKTQKNMINNKIILNEQKKEDQINNIYYKIFPKHIKEKPIEKDSIINNAFNYYCCNNSQQFEEILKKENLKRTKLNKSLIKLTIKNDETKNKIKILRNKAKFIGGIINYCYPKAFVLKINQKKKLLQEQRNLLHKNFLLPSEEIDLIKRIKNYKLTINLINNSFNIMNEKNSKLNVK